MSMRWENNLDLDRLITRLDEVEPEALAQGMEHIRGIASERTPIETGRLVGSATVHVEPELHRAALSFEGPYARYQEFTLTLRHEHGQALYETTALIDGKDDALGIVARTIKDGL